MATDLDFASFLASRLCHDLLSPIGAFSNGLELLADERDPEMRARCMELLNESARSSVAKLRYFRLAFGMAGGYGDAVDLGEAKGIVDALFGSDRTRITWMTDAPTLPKPALRLLLNLVLISGDALVRGGELTIGAEAGAGGTEIVVRAAGDRVILDRDVAATLDPDADTPALSARTSVAHLIRSIVQDGGGQLHFTGVTDGALLLGATLPPADSEAGRPGVAKARFS